MPSNIYRRNAIETTHDSEHPPWFQNEKRTRRAFRFELVAHDTGFITEKPRRATGVEPATPGIQSVCASPRAIVAWLGVDGWTIASDGWLDVIRAPLQRMDRMGRTVQLARYSAGCYLTFDPAEVTGCSATLYATDTRQPAQLHSLCAGRLSSPTPPHYAYVCVLRWNVWAVRGTCLAVAEHVLRMRGGRGAEADLRHVSVSEHPTTDIRVTCTYSLAHDFSTSWRHFTGAFLDASHYGATVSASVSWMKGSGSSPTRETFLNCDKTVIIKKDIRNHNTRHYSTWNMYK